jgi:hypothetical protein
MTLPPAVEAAVQRCLDAEARARLASLTRNEEAPGGQPERFIKGGKDVYPIHSASST